MTIESLIHKTLELQNGVLRLVPNFIERFYPARGRLGVEKIGMENKKWYSERWLASCTSVLGSENYGLSKVELKYEDKRIELTLKDILKIVPEKLLGPYAKLNNYTLGVLTKILDPGVQLPLHFHATEYYAKKYWNSNPKEEAYYYLPHQDPGPLPYIHLGFYPDVTKEDVLKYLIRWKDDSILDYSPAYLCRVGEGFHVLAGVVHAPCTLLTLEVQEESDVGTIIQAYWNNNILPKEQFLLNGPRSEDEIIEMINWEVNKDSDFRRKYKLKPEIISENEEFIERWIFNPNRVKKFSGIEIILKPGSKVKFSRKGPFLLYVHRGKGKIENIDIVGGDPYRDEVLVSYEAAIEHTITNMGKDDLILYEIFPPNVY